jgi:hypothetical protein
MSSTSAVFKLSSADDPKKAIQSALKGALDQIELLHSKVLVAWTELPSSDHQRRST